MDGYKISFPNFSFCKTRRPNKLIERMQDHGIPVQYKNDPKDADYLFLYPNDMHEMYLLCHKYRHKILIFHTGEAIAPDFNLFDYTFGYDPIHLGDRHYVMSNQLITNSLSFKKDFSQKILTKKFCNFIYSNPKAHPSRDTFYNMLSKYRKIDALGNHLKNTTTETEFGRNNNWLEGSVILKSSYKFSISFENAFHVGYHTEKIITSMLAGSIPIYWGDPEIGKIFNTESFINCHDYKNFDEVIELIIDLDTNDDKYFEMLSRPWMTEEQEKKYQEFKNGYFEKIRYILEQPYEKAFRKPVGTWNDQYLNYHASFLQHHKYYKTLKDTFLSIKRFSKLVL